VKVAFIYAYPPESSAWTRAHDHGREYLEKTLGDKVTVSVYHAYNRDYYTEMVKAVSDGAQVIFATTPPMIDACRRIASAFKNVKVLNCALSRPYTGVRMYYSRIYECKFITGAIAGAMAENDLVGYISNFPIIGDPANINAFALGVRMTNPRAKIALRWSCLPGNPLRELMDEGAAVISNRDATNSTNIHWALEWGTYKLAPDGSMTPLAVPCWDWGKFYERVILSILNGSWAALSGDRSVNYWWGLSSGVVSIQFSDLLPPGVASMGKMLVNGISSGFVHPFKTRITDQNGILRNDGSEDFSSAALMDMDWLCDNIEGRIPSYDELLPFAKETVRLFGLSRNLIIPEKETEQL
jgi:basic membrane lipoprotein Med (substrate-binding protein (PBP1-ABC) superfamily)